MVTKEQALDHIAEVYEYAISLSGGPNHPMARDFAVWMQRHWAQAGTNRTTEKRRAKNTASKEAAKPAEPSNLTRFIHPKSPESKAGELQAPKHPEEAQSPRPLKAQAQRPERPEKQKPVAGGKVPGGLTADELTDGLKQFSEKLKTGPLTVEEKAELIGMKPRAIAARFPEIRLAETLREYVGEDETADLTATQKAAMLRNLVTARK